jgi:hypothetical protein
MNTISLICVAVLVIAIWLITESVGMPNGDDWTIIAGLISGLIATFVMLRANNRA